MHKSLVIVGYVAAATIMIYQASVTIKYYIDHPTVTDISSVSTALDQFSPLHLCYPNWRPDADVKRPDLPSLLVPLGFNMGVEDLRKYGKLKFVKESDIRKAMSTYLQSRESYMKELAYHDPNSDNQTLVEPLFDHAMFGCEKFNLSAKPPSSFNRPQEAELFNAKKQFKIAKVTNKATKILKIFMTLYQFEGLSRFNRRTDFLTDEYILRVKSYFQTISIQPTKHILLKSKENRCLVTKPEQILPNTFFAGKCNQDCFLKAIMTLKNCIPLPLWFEGFRDDEMIVCNAFHHGLREFAFNETKLTEETTRCRLAERCNELEPCISWNLHMQLGVKTRQEYSKDLLEFSTLTVLVRMPGKIEIVEQQSSRTFSGVTGNVGGLLGVWCGFSVAGCCASAMGVLGWWKKRLQSSDTKL